MPAAAPTFSTIHLLTQNLGEVGGEDARHDVERAAGGERHDDGHRPCRPVLRRRRRSRREQRCDGGNDSDQRHSFTRMFVGTLAPRTQSAPSPAWGGGEGRGGEGRGGGELARMNLFACPLPVPPPQAGEGIAPSTRR